MRILRIFVILFLVCTATAAKVVIDTADDPSSQLEVRTVTLPDGEEHSVYVVRGEQVTIVIDDETTIVGTHLEFDFDARTVRLVGDGEVSTREETIVARDFYIELDDDRFVADDVLIITGEIDVSGDHASRVPGQIQVAMGEFSPCSRCNQDVHDYGFRGERVDIYPGDRIVAYHATILLREVPILTVPLLVLPIGPPERIPRLKFQRGSDDERAEIAIVWPYVAGANAYGNVGFRYYADVIPGTWYQNFFLGGKADVEYVGGFVDHRFYTDRGSGGALVDYTPGFASGAHEEPVTIIDLRYSDADNMDGTRWYGSVQRHDERYPNIWELQLGSNTAVAPFEVEFRHRFFVERESGKPFTYPSYYHRSAPLNEYFHLVIEPLETKPVDIGPLRLERFAVNSGVYMDFSNPLNRRASVTRFTEAGRIEEWVKMSLPERNAWWPGLRISGASEFRGQQYSTGERQVYSVSNFTFDQAFSDVGSLSVTWRRDVQEGETPFQFDAIAYRQLSDVQFRFRFTPWRWFTLEETGGYLIEDSRAGKTKEWLPLRSRLTLFEPSGWVTLTLSNEYDFAEEDPGELLAQLELRHRGAVRAALEVEHVYDLRDPTFDAGFVVTQSATRAKATVSVNNIVELEAAGGYRYYPGPLPGGLPGKRYEDFTARLLLGTLHHRDSVPGARVSLGYDVNEREVNKLGIELAVTALTLEFDASIEYRFPSHEVSRSRLQVRWPGVALARAEGLAWLPAETFGLEAPQPYNRRITYTVADAPERGGTKWELRYRTDFDPLLDGFKNSVFDARVQVAQAAVGPVLFSIDGSLDVPVADKILDRTYLRRASVTFGAQAWDRIGIQGRVGYTGRYDGLLAEVTEGRLQLQQVSVTVRPFDDLYLGLVLDDIWDITGNSTTYPSFNFQPTFRVVWNRCCWAVYGSWDTESGAITLTLTTPGADEGVAHAFDTDFVFHRREP